MRLPTMHPALGEADAPVGTVRGSGPVAVDPLLRARVAGWGSLDPAQGRHPQTCRNPFMSNAPTHALRAQQVSFKGYRIHAFVSTGEGRDAGRYAMAGRYEVWVPGEVEAAWRGQVTCDGGSVDEALREALLAARASVRSEMRARFAHHSRHLDFMASAPACEHAQYCIHAIGRTAVPADTATPQRCATTCPSLGGVGMHLLPAVGATREVVLAG
jgi:hypothetical protein